MNVQSSHLYDDNKYIKLIMINQFDINIKINAKILICFKTLIFFNAFLL